MSSSTYCTVKTAPSACRERVLVSALCMGVLFFVSERAAVRVCRASLSVVVAVAGFDLHVLVWGARRSRLLYYIIGEHIQGQLQFTTAISVQPLRITNNERMGAHFNAESAGETRNVYRNLPQKKNTVVLMLLL